MNRITFGEFICTYVHFSTSVYSAIYSQFHTYLQCVVEQKNIVFFCKFPTRYQLGKINQSERGTDILTLSLYTLGLLAVLNIF